MVNVAAATVSTLKNCGLMAYPGMGFQNFPEGTILRLLSFGLGKGQSRSDFQLDPYLSRLLIILLPMVLNSYFKRERNPP